MLFNFPLSQRKVEKVNLCVLCGSAVKLVLIRTALISTRSKNRSRGREEDMEPPLKLDNPSITIILQRLAILQHLSNDS